MSHKVYITVTYMKVVDDDKFKDEIVQPIVDYLTQQIDKLRMFGVGSIGDEVIVKFGHDIDRLVRHGEYEGYADSLGFTNEQLVEYIKKMTLLPAAEPGLIIHTEKL